MKKYLLPILTALAVLVFAVFSAGCITGENYEGEQLLVYSGAGLKAPMAEIASVFSEEYGVDVQLTYGGSGVLISQMETTKLGDIFIPGGEPDYENAVKKGLVDEDYQLIAYHIPVIATAKGNPLGLQTVADLAKPGVRLALGDEAATAIGKAGVKIFAKAGVTDAIAANTVLTGATINEVVTGLATGNADAAVLTMDAANKNKDKFDIIEIPVKENFILVTPIGVTTFTENPELAQLFADFAASEKGKAIFEKHGFPAYPNEKYTA